jgi:hypothetical protein
MNITNNIVSIKAEGKDPGTGFIQKIESEFVYIYTARHVILGNEDNEITEITIGFRNGFQYISTSDDFIICGDSNTDEQDVALIIIPLSKIEINTDEIHTLEFINIDELTSDTPCFISGFPKSTRERHLRTLNQCYVIKDKDFNEQIQIESVDPIMSEYNVDSLFIGYSGSGIFLCVSDTIYVFGLVTSYEKNTKRIKGINPTAINHKITEKGFKALEVKTVELNLGILKDIEKLNTHTASIIARVQDQIGDIHLDRKELCDATSKLIKSRKNVLITGKAGVGKSALIRTVLSSISSDYNIIAFKGDDIDRKNLKSILTELHIENDITCILNSPNWKKEKIVLIDSFEKLLETDNTDTIFDFFSLINDREDIKLVITCRSYAVEQLKARFINVFNNVEPIDIPVLSDDELSKIKDSYPHLSNLLANLSIREILKIPFNIDKAIYVSKNILYEEITTEKQLKNLMWSYIIEGKAKIGSSIKQKERGEAFVKIAKERAKAMTSFVAIPVGVNQNVIQGMEEDNLLVRNNSDCYIPSHDIYEDWALTKFIEEEYNKWIRDHIDIQLLFNAIGDEPAIRRAFRIWIYEKLQEIDFDITHFVLNIIENTHVKQYWIDETLIAIIQSDICLDFLNDNKEAFYKSNFKYFKRLLLLLKVACQETDYSLINKLEGEDKLAIYQSHCLKPVGNGWANIIQFIHDNLKSFDNNEMPLLIINILISWGNILSNTTSEDFEESECAGKILLHYFEEKQNIKNYPYKECATLLFKLTRVIKKEIEKIIKNELILDLDETNHYDSKIIKYALSWQYSKELAKHIPETLIDLMEKKWFYYPDKEKLKEYHSILDHSYYRYREPKKDERCGVNDSEHSFTYYPSSAYQTPIYHLLSSNPYPTLRFIVKLYDHSINVYKNYGEDIKEVKLEYEDQTIVQYGNQELWNLYRQGTSFSDLLECILMALDKWLLEIAKLSNNEGYDFLKDFIVKAFSILIQTKNVAVTSVLASLAVAYPDLLGDKVFTLLKIKDFFQWDLRRITYELDLTSFVIDARRYPLQLKERQEASKLLHRKEHLEWLMLYHSQSIYKDIVFSIIDGFHNDNPKDEIWRIALNRMDFRKREIVGKTDKYVVLMPKIDEDLKPSMDSVQKQIEADQPFLNLSAWARNVYDRKKNDATYVEWQKHYFNSRSEDTKMGMSFFYNSPGTLAAVGIRDFYSELTGEEGQWCVDTILEITSKILNKDYLSFGDYNILDKSPVLSTLPLLLSLIKDERNIEIKKTLFYCILNLSEDNDYEKIRIGIQDHLHPLNDEYLYSLLAGTVEYARLKRELYSEKDKIQIEIEKLVERIISNDIFLNNENVHFEDLNYIIYGLLCISPSTSNPHIAEFVKVLLTIFKSNLQREGSRYRNKELSFTSKWYFELFLAKFVLEQSNDISLETFNSILDCVYIREDYYNKPFEDFVESFLTKMIALTENEHSDKFKYLWGILYQKNTQRKDQLLSNFLLLYGNGDLWYPQTKKWEPMQGAKILFKDAIYNIRDIKLSSAFLSGVGFTETLPDGVHWYADLLKDSYITSISEKMELYYTERLIQRLFYDNEKRKVIKNSSILRNDFIYVLDILINSGSAIAFIVREDFISAK